MCLLENGGIVIADRSFITSLVFQGYGRDAGIRTTLKINKSAIESIIPDLVIFLDLDPNLSIKRAFDKNRDKSERMGAEFFYKVRKGYLKISKRKMFRNKWLNVKVTDAPIEQNFDLILKALKPYLKKFDL